MKSFAFKKGMVFTVILLFISVALASGITAYNKSSLVNTIYVDDDNTNGPWDGTQEHPYQFIKDAIDNASDGDTIYVFNGIYYEQIVVDKSIFLFGEDKNTTIIDGRYIPPCNHHQCIVIVYASGVDIRGFTIKNGGTKNFGIELCGSSNIYSNILSNNSIGIHQSFTRNEIVGNIIFDNFCGISAWCSPNSIIKGNTVQNCFYAIRIIACDRSEISENECSNNTYAITLSSIDEFYTSYSAVYWNNITYNEYGISLHAYNWGAVYLNKIFENSVEHNKYGIFLSSDAQKSKVEKNNLSKNTIRYNSKYGIYLNNTQYTSILNNNLISNRRNAYFQDCDNTTWIGNYWNKPRIFPKPIIGIMTIQGLFDEDKSYALPVINIDWHPAKEPYDIP